MAGSPGTWSSLSLRVGQFAFAAASFGVMTSAPGFTNYTALLLTMIFMGAQAVWSLGLACLEGHALKFNKNLLSHGRVLLFAIVDGTLSLLTFTSACSAGGLVFLFDRDINFCGKFPQLPCGKYELATALALLSSALSATSALVMFWLEVSIF